jgi:histidinol phosphatase-like enzyme
MLLEAINHYNIDPKLSWIIGDSLCDIEAGLKSNLNTIFLDRKKSDFTNLFEHNSPNFTINNLSEISKIIN